MKTGKLVVAVLIILAGSLLAKGQTDPSLETGLKPYGSYHGGDLDSVNLSNGNLTLHIPLPDYSQRGSLAYGPHLTYNNKGWSVNPNCNSRTGICSPFWVWNGESVTLNSFYGGTGVPSSTWLSADQVFVDWEPAYKGAQTFVFTATTTDGSVHQLASLPGGGMLTIDGTDIWYDGSQPISHLQGVARNSQGIDVTDLKDTNGNFLSISTSIPATLTDTLGRVLPSPQSGGTTDFSGCTGPLPTAGAGIMVLPGFGPGGTKQIKFCSAGVALQTNFQASAYFNQNLTAIAEHGVGAANNLMLQSVVLYNGVSWASSPAWTFEYNSRNTGDSSSVNYGDLTKITMPTGGTISYTWGTNGTCSALTDTPTAPVSRVVTLRTVNANDGTGPQTWNYTNGRDPNGNDTIHTFTALNNSCSLYETVTKYYQGSSNSGTLLKTVNTDYRWIPNPFDTVNPNNTLTTVTQVFPIRITTTWPNGEVTKIEKDYDNDLQISAPGGFTGTYGNVIETREYDYGNGAPGSLLRRTDYTYKAFDGSPSSAAYLAANLVHLVSSVTVYDGNSTQVSSTTYGYDESSLQASSITTQHDTSLPNPGTRGNLTSVSHWLNTTGGTITAKTAYYDTGTIYQVTDPLGNTTTNFYTTGFQSGSSFVGAYVTQVQNALQQNTYLDYDFNTGLRTALKDPNSRVSTWDYDFLNRTLHSNAPDQGKVTWAYSDTQPPSFTVTSTITSSLNHLVEADLDGLGRLAHSKLKSDPAGVDTVDTTYDPLGRVATVSNPYRTTSDPTYGVTSYQYDALGRITQVTRQDGSISSSSYTNSSGQTGRAAQTQDEGNGGAHVTHITQTDALGRLANVCEVSATTQANGNAPAACNLDIAGNGFLTTYQYDALNNLKSVQQGAVSRSFTFDSLSRLLSATNPESGTTSYTYDNNGNVKTRTRAAPNQGNPSVQMQTSYQYDVLNRLTQTTYCLVASCPTRDPLTPAVTRHYDTTSELGVTLTNTVGRLSAEYANDVNGNLLSGRVYGYDPVGRVIDNSQCTPQNCPGGTAFSVSYSYDLFGDMLSATNGEQVTFSYGYDATPRLSSITSSLSNSTHPGTLLSGVNYNALGSPTTASLGSALNEQFKWDCRSRMLGYASAIAPATPSLSLPNTPNCPNTTALNIGPYQPDISEPFLRLAGFGISNRLKTSILLSGSGKRSKVHGSVRISLRSHTGAQVLKEPAVPYREGETVLVIAKRLVDAVNKRSDEHLSAAIRPLGSDAILELTFNGPRAYSIPSVSLSITSNRNASFIRAIDLGPPGQRPFVFGAGTARMEGQ